MFLKHLIIYTWILQGKPERISFWFISLHEAYCRRDVHAAGWGGSCQLPANKQTKKHRTRTAQIPCPISSGTHLFVRWTNFLVNNLCTTQQKMYVPLWTRKVARRPWMMQKARAKDHTKLLDHQENSSTYFVHSRTKFLQKIFNVSACVSLLGYKDEGLVRVFKTFVQQLRRSR